MSRLLKSVHLWVLPVLLGCASTPGTLPEAEQRVAIDTQVLRADLALQRQDLVRATELYLDAALQSDDPELAERATSLAYQAENNRVGERAAQRWRTLAPADGRPLQFLGFFAIRAGRLDEAVDYFGALAETVGDVDAALGAIADTLASQTDGPTAVTVMSSLTRHYPDSVRGQYGLARLALSAGDFDRALEGAAAAARLGPDWIDAQLLYARTLMLVGQTDRGLSLAAALAEQHDTVEVQLEYAELLLSAGHADDARTRLDAILEANPGMPEAVRALAFLAMTQGELSQAEERFGQLRTDPRYRDEAFYYLGRIAETEAQFLQATRAYSRVLEGSHAVEAQLRTARILLQEMRDEEGALRHLREFGAANPDYQSEMLAAQGQLLLQLARPEDALDLLSAAVAADPEDARLHEAHAQVIVIVAQDAANRDDLRRAEALLEQGLDLYPSNASLRYAQVLLWQRQGRMRRAVTALEQLVADYPENPTLLNALGYLLTDELGRHDEARTYIQRALALEPDNAAIIDSMGWVLYHLGEFDAARDYLERAYRLENDPEIAAHLIQTYLGLGQRDLALGLLDDSLATHPDSPHLIDLDRRLQR